MIASDQRGVNARAHSSRAARAAGHLQCRTLLSKTRQTRAEERVSCNLVPILGKPSRCLGV